jgi:hypothetical protein
MYDVKAFTSGGVQPLNGRHTRVTTSPAWNVLYAVGIIQVMLFQVGISGV